MVTRNFKMEEVCMESYGTLDKDELISRTWMNVEEGPSHNSKEIHKYYEHCLN